MSLINWEVLSDWNISLHTCFRPRLQDLLSLSLSLYPVFFICFFSFLSTLHLSRGNTHPLLWGFHLLMWLQSSTVPSLHFFPTALLVYLITMQPETDKAWHILRIVLLLLQYTNSKTQFSLFLSGYLLAVLESIRVFGDAPWAEWGVCLRKAEPPNGLFRRFSEPRPFVEGACEKCMPSLAPPL